MTDQQTTPQDAATAALLRTAANWLDSPDDSDLVLRDLVMHITREARRFTEDLAPEFESGRPVDVEALTAAWLTKVSEDLS